MKAELKQIIKELSEVINEEKLNITHSELMDFAVRILNSQSINKKSYPLKNELPNNLEPKENDGLATKQQIYFLKKAGIEVKEGLSKKDAFMKIKELKR
jgi:antitoxin component of RelBE/YafQ-DinJ toxin-antitoxin module